MKDRIKNILTFLLLVSSLNSCCIGAKENYLGNNIYLSEFDNVDRRILYQTESCATSGVEIVPMTVLEVSYNDKWIIVKSGNKRKETDIKYWVIRNHYESTPDSGTVKKNTTEFDSKEDFEKFLFENNIQLKLKRID